MNSLGILLLPIKNERPYMKAWVSEHPPQMAERQSPIFNQSAQTARGKEQVEKEKYDDGA